MWVKHKQQSGFTIVELLIVIVVIALLAAISIVAYNGVQQRARDSQRKSDLALIAKAIELRAVDYDYNLKWGNECVTGSGAGGWFAQTGTALNGTAYGAKSAALCLVEESSGMSKVMTDPSKATSCISSSPSTCFAYMFSTCNNETYIFAHLETQPINSSDTDTTCAASNDSAWGMNYFVKATAS